MPQSAGSTGVARPEQVVSSLAHLAHAPWPPTTTTGTGTLAARGNLVLEAKWLIRATHRKADGIESACVF